MAGTHPYSPSWQRTVAQQLHLYLSYPQCALGKFSPACIKWTKPLGGSSSIHRTTNIVCKQAFFFCCKSPGSSTDWSSAASPRTPCLESFFFSLLRLYLCSGGCSILCEPLLSRDTPIGMASYPGSPMNSPPHPSRSFLCVLSTCLSPHNPLGVPSVPY